MYSPLHASVPSLCAPGHRPASGVAIGKEKATAATVAFCGAFQRSLNIQDTSTKVLSVQGQSTNNHQNSLNSIVALGKTGATNTKGGWRH